MRAEVVERLGRGEWEALADQAARRPALLRALVGRLWEAEAPLRAAAAAALGEVAARAPERGAELVRRFVWALNEESGTNGEPVVPALHAMAQRAPQVVGPFAGALAAHLADERLRGPLLAVLGVLAAADPRWVAPCAEALERWGGRVPASPPAGGEEAVS